MSPDRSALCSGACPPELQGLILRWIGTAWKQMPSPNVLPARDDDILYRVAATSASNAWAVGEFIPGPNGTEHRTLAFHC